MNAVAWSLFGLCAVEKKKNREKLGLCRQEPRFFQNPVAKPANGMTKSGNPCGSCQRSREWECFTFIYEQVVCSAPADYQKLGQEEVSSSGDAQTFSDTS